MRNFIVCTMRTKYYLYSNKLHVCDGLAQLKSRWLLNKTFQFPFLTLAREFSVVDNYSTGCKDWFSPTLSSVEAPALC